jgi:hypothetical protein
MNERPVGCECEETVCDVCFDERVREMEKHFGLRPGMLVAERINQLNAVRPLGCDPIEDES